MTEYEGPSHDAAALSLQGSAAILASLSASAISTVKAVDSIMRANNCSRLRAVVKINTHLLKERVRAQFEQINRAGIVFDPGIGRALVLGPTRMRIVATPLRWGGEHAYPVR